MMTKLPLILQFIRTSDCTSVCDKRMLSPPSGHESGHSFSDWLEAAGMEELLSDHLPPSFICSFLPPDPGSDNDGAGLLSHSFQQLPACSSLGTSH